MSDEIKQMLDENIAYLATATNDGTPNVVPIGLAHAISDDELLIHDVFFNKTRKNLEDNPQVAISFTDVKRWESYQLKGNAKIYTEGEMFEKVLEIMENHSDRHKDFLAEISDPKVKDKVHRMAEWREKLKPKAAVLVTVEEIYSHMPKFEEE